FEDTNPGLGGGSSQTSENHPTPPAVPGADLGLLGLRERLAVYGGTLEAGPRPTGGFRVRAVLPVREDRPTEGVS
ncbi:hypothetical protein ACFWEY_25925, partial [Streptomyces nigra]